MIVMREIEFSDAHNARFLEINTQIFHWLQKKLYHHILICYFQYKQIQIGVKYAFNIAVKAEIQYISSRHFTTVFGFRFTIWTNWIVILFRIYIESERYANNMERDKCNKNLLPCFIVWHCQKPAANKAQFSSEIFLIWCIIMTKQSAKMSFNPMEYIISGWNFKCVSFPFYSSELVPIPQTHSFSIFIKHIDYKSSQV